MSLPPRIHESAQPADGIHGIRAVDVADETARLALAWGPLDVTRCVREFDTGEVWTLLEDDPTDPASWYNLTPVLATVALTGDYNDLDNLPTLGTAAALNVPASGNAAVGEVVKGTDTRLSDARQMATATADVDFGTHKGKNLTDPAAGSQEAATAHYVDAQGITTGSSFSVGFTLVAGDANLLREYTGAVRANVVIPPNASVPIAVGKRFGMWASAAGMPYFQAGAGVTILNPGQLYPRTKYLPIWIRQVSADRWLIETGYAPMLFLGNLNSSGGFATAASATGGTLGVITGFFVAQIFRLTNAFISSGNVFGRRGDGTTKGWDFFAPSAGNLTFRCASTAGAMVASPSATFAAADVGKVFLIVGWHDGTKVRIAKQGVEVGTGTAITGYTAGGTVVDTYAAANAYAVEFGGRCGGAASGGLSSTNLSDHYAACVANGRIVAVPGLTTDKVWPIVESSPTLIVEEVAGATADNFNPNQTYLPVSAVERVVWG